jgi:membrane fusion protein (multidrug efflux system)
MRRRLLRKIDPMNQNTPLDREKAQSLTDETTTKSSARTKGFLLLGAAVVIAAGGYYGFKALSTDHQSTDDAYVAGNIVQVAARDAGTVVAIHADSTQSVTAGQPLVDLDTALADNQLASAEAELARAVRSVRSDFTKVNTASAQIAQANVRLDAARADLARRERAAASGAISAEEVAHAQEAVRMASAALELANSQRADADSSVGGTDVNSNPAVLAAIAAVRRAALQRAHMQILAPADGVVAQRPVQLGQQVASGAPLVSIAQLQRLWIDANFRETQLAELRVGQPVTIHADAYGKDVTYHGKVIGLGAGSGSAFALLPAQNASGNWIKIVQRVPVRIGLDPKELAAHPLRIGLSVDVDVDTKGHEGTPVTALPSQPQPSAASDTISPQVEARIRQIIAANAGRR